MKQEVQEKLIKRLTEAACPILENEKQFDALLGEIGDARVVLLGEASHGTHEFYEARIQMTKQLIKEKGFMAVAIEGDWPDVYQMNRYVQGYLPKEALMEAFSEFKRYPRWMWRNASLPPFLAWLREYNDSVASDKVKVGIYGLDLYSLNTSMQAVIQYLDKVDPEGAKRARERYLCFDHLGCEPQSYGYSVSQHIKKPCFKEALAEVMDLQYRAFDYVKKDNSGSADNYFYAVQNARLVKDAEHYYRSMFEGRDISWNVRDTHMADTLDTLSDHIENRFGHPAKVIVWAHNSHVGDARATEMSERGELNIGQLARERHGDDVYSVGFSTHSGFVTASDDWDTRALCKAVNPGLPGSYEDLFHQVPHKNFILNLKKDAELEHYLQIPRLQRAIGVIYRPETERGSHYFFTRLPYQFDTVIHFDKTTAVLPLD